jgi:hypothetical protein
LVPSLYVVSSGFDCILSIDLVGSDLVGICGCVAMCFGVVLTSSIEQWCIIDYARFKIIQLLRFDSVVVISLVEIGIDRRVGVFCVMV